MLACIVRILGALAAFDTKQMEYLVAIDSERDENCATWKRNTTGKCCEERTVESPRTHGGSEQWRRKSVSGRSKVGEAQRT